MKRSDFLKRLGLIGAASIIAPKILAESDGTINEAKEKFFKGKDYGLKVAKSIEKSLLKGYTFINDIENANLEVVFFNSDMEFQVGVEYKFWIFGCEFSPHRTSVYGDTTIHELYKGKAISKNIIKLNQSIFQRNENIHEGDYLMLLPLNA